MIKPWLFEFLPELGGPSTEPNAQDVATLFGRYLDLWVRDEALGFEGIFFSEHHFGRSYSPSPNLLIAALGPRTKTLRLGVMGVVLPYYHPARVAEEIGMLDAALTNRIVSHNGKYFSFSDLRLLPRPLQQPFPPRWTTVISAESARRAARRRVKISTGFNATQLIKRIFDAYREEADKLGFAAGPEYFALRRRVTVAPTTEQAHVYAHAVTERLKSFVAEDERLSTQAPDAPAPSGGFTLSDDEFITGTPEEAGKRSSSSAEPSALDIFLPCSIGARR